MDRQVIAELKRSGVIRKLQAKFVEETAERRRVRHIAHKHLDRFWKVGPNAYRGRKRNGVYRWLARNLQMSRHECHLTNFDCGICEEVIRLCKQAEVGLIPGPRMPNGIRDLAKYHKQEKRSSARRPLTM